MTQPKQRQWAVRLLLYAVLALAAYTRTTNSTGVFKNGRVFLMGLDSHFHMRRVEITLASFPSVPHFDAYANAPEGALIDWPVGFDFVLATLCLLVETLSGGAITPDETAALFNPALGVAVCAVIFLVGRQLRGAAAGLTAAAIAALLPILTGYSNIGRVDHHAAEPLLVAVPFLALLHAVGGVDAGVSAEALRRRAMLMGAALALSIGVWPGSIAVSGVAFVGLALPALRRETPLALVRIGRDGFAAATIVMLVVSAIHPWFWQQDFGYYAASWFQPLCFLVAWATFEAVLRVRRRSRVQRAAAMAVVAIALWALAFLLLQPLRDSILAAVGYVGRGEAQISQVHESQPLLSAGVGTVHEHYTTLAYVFFLLPWTLWQHRQNEKIRMLSVWLGATAVFALAQVRLGSLFAPMWCAAWGVAAVEAYAFLRKRARLSVVVTTLSAAALVVVVPVAPQYARADFSGTAQFVQSFEALQWFRNQAPSPGNVMRPKVPPAFTVMGRWQWGHWITQVGLQANVANPLGQTQGNLRGVRDSARYFLCRDPDVAMQALEARNARYVLVTPIAHELSGMVLHTGDELSTFFEMKAEGVTGTRAFYETMSSRLLHFDALPMKVDGVVYPPLRRMRMVFESAAGAVEMNHQTAYAKIFERVAGARLVGEASPGARVRVIVRMRTNKNRPFSYSDATNADDAGAFVLRVPYATEAVFGVRAEGAYHLFIGKKEIASATVTNDNVLFGETVTVTPTPP